MGKAKTQSTTQALDPKSQAYVDAQRRAATAGAGVATSSGPFFTGPQTMSIQDQVSPFMNPYISNVVDATRAEYDNLRAKAQVGTNQQATMSGAFGGSRHAIASGARLGEIDRAEGSQISDLYNTGYNNALTQGVAYSEHQRQLQEQQMQEPLFRQQQAMQFLNMGMGPTGSTTTQKTSGNLVGDLAGLGMIGASFFGGPAGAADAGAVGGAGGSANPGMRWPTGSGGSSPFQLGVSRWPGLL